MKRLEHIVQLGGAITLLSLSGCTEMSYDTGLVGTVVLYPLEVRDLDDIHCRVDESSENVFDYYWLVNRASVFSEGSIPSSTLQEGYTHRGDYIECSVWTPRSSSYGSFEIAIDGIYVE